MRARNSLPPLTPPPPFPLQAIKDMRVTSTNDLVSVQTGKLVHVLSTEARSPVSGWDASWTDEKLNALKTLTLTLASGSKTTGEVVAVIRVDNTTVVVVIKSPVVPAVLIKDKEVYILTDADVEAVVQAVLAGEKLSTELMDLLMKTRIGSDMVMGSGMMTPRPM